MTHVSVIKRKHAVFPPPAESEQKLTSHIDEIKPENAATVQRSAAGRKGIDPATQKRIYDLSKQDKNAQEIATEVGCSYQTARKYMSAKAARGVKPVFVKASVVEPKKQKIQLVKPEVPAKESVNQLEMACNMYRLAKQWNVSFDDLGSLVEMAKTIHLHLDK